MTTDFYKNNFFYYFEHKCFQVQYFGAQPKITVLGIISVEIRRLKNGFLDKIYYTTELYNRISIFDQKIDFLTKKIDFYNK